MTHFISTFTFSSVIEQPEFRHFPCCKWGFGSSGMLRRIKRSLETSVANYQLTLCNIPEERRPLMNGYVKSHFTLLRKTGKVTPSSWRSMIHVVCDSIGSS